MQVLPLNKSKYAVCDAVAWNHLMEHNWTAKVQRNYYYATRHRKLGEEGRELIYLHMAVAEFFGMDVPEGYVIDHINHDGLDNRKDNLRVVTISQNARNAGQLRQTKSGYIGVRFDRDKQLYKAYYSQHGREIHVCYTADPKSAAMYRDKAVLKLYDNAALNFPELAVEAGKQVIKLAPYELTAEDVEFLNTHKRVKKQPRRKA